MDRYPGYESMLTRVEHMKMQVKAQLPTEYSQTVDNMVDFVLDEVNQCCDVATVDATTSTDEDHLLSVGPVARADDTRIDVNEHVNPASPQVDHHLEGSISNEQTVSPVVPPPPATHSTIHTNIEVKVEDESNGQSVQLCEWIKKEEDEDDYEEQLFHCCDCGGEGCEECKVKLEIKEELDESGFETELCGNSAQGCIRVKQEEEDSEGQGVRPRKMLQYVSSGHLVQHFKCVKKEEEDGGEYVMECDCEDCETCRVKMEMKEELDESGETELGGNSVQTVQGCTSVKKEEGEDEYEVERPNKIRRMDRGVGNVPVGSQSPLPNVISINVECLDDQMATSFFNRITIEGHAQPSQPVTITTSIVTPTQPSSSAQPVNEPLRDQLLNDEPMMDNVVEVLADEFDREQFGDGNSTLNPVHTEQDDEEDEANVEDNQNVDDNTIEPQREDLSADDDEQQVQVAVENFMKRIKPTDEQGNRYLCEYRGCGRRMKQRTDLIRHIRSHIGEKRFKCSVAGCDLAFVRNAQLKRHLNTHSGTRPFVCTWPGCEARFAQKIHLTAHLRTHTGERPFKCDQCNATFTQHSHLVTHLRTHTGSRPFVCTWPECGQAFICSSHLKTHSHVHSNERQFVCDVTGCTKVYKSKDALRRHQKDQHN